MNSKIERLRGYRNGLAGLLLIFCVNLTFSQDEKHELKAIPEPLNFDLIRGVGPKKGELEVNALADFPINHVSSREVEWAPEIEYALFDDFAVELEFPFENFKLEAYKGAIQWTMGRSKSGKYIHGIQIIGEKLIHDDIFELNLLYVPAYRFNDVWSAIGLFGVMLEYGDDSPEKNNTILLNASLFADINDRTVLGLEINNSDPTLQKIDDNEMELLLLPQMHYAFESGFSFQFGLGPKFTKNKTDVSVVLRVIQEF